MGFGDNLDPTNNPAVLLADGAEAVWAAKGPSGKACADCHAGGVASADEGRRDAVSEVRARRTGG